MSDIEIHIKADGITIDKTFSADDREAARGVQELVAYILGHVVGTPTASPRPSSRRTKRETGTALATVPADGDES